MMFELLNNTLQGLTPQPESGQTADFNWQWWGEGVVALTPHQACDQALVLSAGIHGDETAPIELLDQLVSNIFSGRCRLRVHLLVILGNPPAIRCQRRYLSADMNRMFADGYQRFTASAETQRAQYLEQCLARFFHQAQLSGACQRFHLDMHTAIRSSIHRQFALLPWQSRPYSKQLYQWLLAADLDALVTHKQAGNTFSQVSSSRWQAQSCTLELGKALPFGENDLPLFARLFQALSAWVAQSGVAARQKGALACYQVAESLIKQHEDFVLHIPPDTANFTAYPQGTLLAQQSGEDYRVSHQQVWILFPNPHVALGLRAALLLIEQKDLCDNVT
jgi:succinylglutamate desuccinylase